jgi:hypothetical protein
VAEPPAGGDHGAADPTLTAALAGYDGSPAAVFVLETALAATRLLVPVEARPEGGPAGGERGPVHMAVPGLVGRDGRLALPVFSCLAALRAWRGGDARPVPMPAGQACAGALEHGYAALFLDPAGPVPVIVDPRRLLAIVDRAEGASSASLNVDP